jgi:MoxR-like ATPase
MLEGPPGSGKTKIVKIISRLMTRSSLGNPNNIIYCDEEMSKEKWMAFPDIKKMLHSISPDHVNKLIDMIDSGVPIGKIRDGLNKLVSNDQGGGEFDVIWSDFFTGENNMNLIVDEINRANPRTQNELLSLMAEGIAQYAVPAKIKVKNFHLFFTQNPLDDIMGGPNIFPLSHAFKDRVSQYVIVSQPPGYAMEMVSEIRRDDRNYEYDEDKEIKPIMTIDQVQASTILAGKIHVTDEAAKYARYISRDVSLCLRSPMNDKTHSKDDLAGRSLCDGCHFAGLTTYHCQKFIGGSMRMYNDLIAFSKAYAFMLGLEEVNEYLIQSIASDIVSHRVLILPEKLREDKKYGKNSRKFLKTYLIDWCFGMLNTRAVAEDAYKRLYRGTSEHGEEDLRVLVTNAQNDLYIRVDLLPKVVDIDIEENENLKEKGIKILSSVNSPKYRDFATKISSIENDAEMNNERKKDSLYKLAEEIPGMNIDFFGNLIDMIYAIYPKINAEQERDQFTRGGKNNG